MSGPAGLRILAVTGGHRVDTAAFDDVLAGICTNAGWQFTHVVQPEAQQWLTVARADSYDVVLAHDLPGLDLRRGHPPTPVGPTSSAAADLVELLEAGKGFVFLHHALAGWPGWPGWADVLGGRYHYAPAHLHGRAWPDSGYRYAEYTAQVIAPQHPVCAGLTDFELADELYCCPVFEDEVVPLVRAEVSTDPGQFSETYNEVMGTPRTEGTWQHPPASDLIAWAKVAGRSPIAYIQPGDGPATFADSSFRRLLANALGWVGSPPAHAWAADHPTTIETPIGATAGVHL